MRLRIVQMRIVPEKGALDLNFDRLRKALQSLEQKRIDVVITPECYLDGYVVTEESVGSSELKKYAIDPENSYYTEEISSWARQNAAWMIFGCCRLSDKGVYNTALIFDRQGKLHGHYDKTHCQTHDSSFLPGQSLPVIESDFGRFGILICADRRWPEAVRSLALQGAGIIFNPTYGNYSDRNLRMMQTRSYESEIFIAFTHPEQSLTTNARGEICCNVYDGETDFTITEIDLSQVNRVRIGPSSHLRDRRPDLYITETVSYTHLTLPTICSV